MHCLNNSQFCLISENIRNIHKDKQIYLFIVIINVNNILSIGLKTNNHFNVNLI